MVVIDRQLYLLWLVGLAISEPDHDLYFHGLPIW